MKIYAVYKGEKFLCEGTVQECAEYLKVKPETIWWWATTANKKRASVKKRNGTESRRKIAIVIDNKKVRR